MTDQTEIDYEKKFQEDLEKATALSLESLALDQYRRTKLQYSHSDISVSKRVAQHQRERNAISTPSNQSRSRPASIKSGGSIDYDLQSPLGPPPSVPPRRHSEIHIPDKNLSTTDESDLISFTSPTNKKDENINFDNLIEEIQRLNVAQNQSSNIQPNYSAAYHQTTPPITSNNQPSLQLVPYNNLQQQQQQQTHKTPLTNEQLQKLYSMQPQQYRQPQQIRPYLQAQSAPPLPASPFSYSPAVLNYGFNPNIYPTPPINLTNQTPPPQLPTALQFPNIQTVANPETALVATAMSSGQHQTPAATSSTNPSIQHQITPIPKSASLSGVSSITAGSNTSSNSSGNITRPSKIVNKSNSTAGTSGEIQRRPKKSLCDDLIDLGHEDNSRVSVLEAFDPLLSKEWNDSDNSSDCATSYYSEYDPFDYLYSVGTQYSDPVYEAVNKTDRTPLSPAAPIGWNIPAFEHTDVSATPSTSENVSDCLAPPPLPPRNSYTSRQQQTKQVLDRRKGATKLYETITDRKTYDAELMEFYYMVRDLRCQYKHNDARTNVGYVIAAEFDYSYSPGTSIKLLVHPSLDALKRSNDVASQGQISGYGPPIQFTCDISTTVEHVAMHAFCELEGQVIGNVNDFMLKPIDVVEWLSPTSKLNQLECVHASIKLEQDVQLGLCVKTEANMKAIARTAADDLRDMALKPEDILPNEHMSTTTFDNMMILIETLEAEIEKLESVVADSGAHTIISCSGVVQGVKAICAVIGSIDTLEICEMVEDLKNICNKGQVIYTYNSPSSPDIVSESGDYAEVLLRPKSTLDQVKLKCNYLRESIQQLIGTYANAFRVDFCVNTIDYATTPIPISCVLKPIMVNVSCLYRPPPNWKYDDYILGAQIYHGTRYISQPFVTQCSNDTTGGLFPRLKFDTWITFESNPICTLPRESRLIFVLYGCRAEPAEGNEQSTDNTQERKKITTELGWGAVQLFDFQSNMIFGTYLLSLWPPTTDKFLGPAPPKGSHPQPDFCPVLSIEVPTYGGRIIFPEPPANPPPAPRYDFNSLDCNLQQELLDTAEQGYSGTLDKREVLWEKRHYLQAFPHALPKVLHAAHSWDYASLIDLHSLLNSWTPLAPLQSLELLLPRYPDMEVRKKAVKWISRMRNDQIVDFLPQLLQALKHDTYDASPMAQFLLCKSLESPRIAHHLYWLLVHSLPGDAPQNSIDGITGEADEGLITQTRYHRRNKMMLRALLAICGEKLSSRFLAQNMMCKSLAETAQNVKQAKESMRQKTLIQGLEIVNQVLLESPTSLPLDPALEVYGVNSRNSSFFNSFTLPLKVSFLGPDRGILPAIFKCGDDLQQDMLTIQLIRIMDKLWLAEGLDLKMVTFNCVPTSYKKGMIELVTDAETLRKIQVEYGLTGSFKDRPIAEWLARQNPSQLEYKRAVDNFTYSCAGYSVATYILGICDRHNDNIMLKTSGHLFHIDFGKFLGDAQMFGNFKRDRTPFVLTSDMAYVINGGDKPSTAFHNFVDLCCKAFNIVRKHGDLLLHMLALMASAGIPGVTADAVTYVRRALLLSQSNPEAAASFAKMIQFSLKSWFTQFNFFLHNLAQMRFTNDEGGGELLSFIPRTYTMKQDGRLKSVTVVNYQKRYDLEKYYTYILKVTRHGQPDPTYLFRSYKEFCEFHQKLCLHFPLVKLHSLPSGIHVGRSNIKTVAERRLPEIRKFLVSLFLSADEIAHSDLVYTFFHPILRDQQEDDINVAKVKVVPPLNPTEQPICGEIKLSLQYRRGALTVMIHHARGLAKLAGGQEPNTYVKCYLRPDPTKATKRKTKVVRKTCVPSFMETLEYRMPIEYIRNRILEVTVWSHDTLQENVLLGGYQLPLAELDLREEVMQWCRLGYLPRSKRDAPQ